MISEVYAWVREIVAQQQAQCPVLEVGSYNVNGSVRDLFFGEYIGMDMREGPGVDVIADITEDWLLAGVKLAVGRGGDPVDYYGSRVGVNANRVMPPRFKTVVCTETLEHCTDPFKAVEQMYDALAPDGLAIVSVPFLWNFHDYPSDYWRVTPPGLELLFERAGFTAIACAFGGQALDEQHTYSHTLGIARRAA
jgi:SAM-dependent methyltransferase